MKKQVKAVICVILAVWFFFMGFELGSYREKKAANTVAPATTTEAVPTATTTPTAPTAPITETPATTAPAESKPDESKPNESQENKDTTKAENADPSSLSKEQIIAKMSDAINTAKASNVTATKNEKVTINLTDLSVQSLMSTVQKVMDSLAGEETETYTFANGLANGTDADGKAVENKPVNEVMPPKAAFGIAPEGVVQATATKDGDNTVYKIKTVEESTTKDSPIPQYSAAVYSYLDLMSIDIPVPGVAITEANMHYPGTEVTATVAPDGKLMKLDYNMPMDGTGVAKIVVTSGTASFEGSDVESWTFQY